MHETQAVSAMRPGPRRPGTALDSADHPRHQGGRFAGGVSGRKIIGCKTLLTWATLNP
jgi:hypothetical protein